MNAFQWLYSDVVKDHFVNPRNVFDPDEGFKADAEGVVGNIKCGDQMMFLLKIKDDLIEDVRWKTYGCASAIASTSMLSESVKGMGIREAYRIKPSDIAAKLGGLPENKIHCSVLGDKALRAAIDQYLEKQGRKGEFKGEDAVVICTCLNITDKDIEEAVKAGARDWQKLQEATKIGTVCGGCKSKAEELLHEFVHIYS
ncbi:MAG: iron-sulfur cluster assembly scaffold protein [Spirochaetia bacterium]|jgi:nitrogen fixation NifU-like protein|uniref:Iron-sulfur cluster assembly scaffold protein IscU n=1 Tax=bioreactor metagenome TaxID=1076179 RepID=A0A644SWL1_9ZZZZ|nr:iron-sulfur cluster assembly scaffold protein [Spirochaetia bacterium]MCE1209493.1 iron-sulfur cluster assembly scaffold protein [Spirochaetia bacterium]NLX45514.1 iron-sulfur cluster assembly scaffold protein [Treponema sp.]VBB39464.1 IscU protein [uncultured Spirochaetota bacterium]